jgi:DNA polymerase I-like protein with 3'-5' exonuclease and polymerase domains
MDQFFDTYPAVKLVMEYYWNMVREYGYIVTVWGRKRRLPDYNLPRIQLMEMENRTVEIEDEALLDYYTYKWDNARTAKQRAAIKEEANNNGVWLVDNSSKIADCERQILNAVIQGTSADITKLAMLLLDRDERLRKLDYHMLLTVHDEIIGEVPQENALKAAAIVREIMLGSTAEKILTPMSVDMDITRVWYGEDITEELKAA